MIMSSLAAKSAAPTKRHQALLWENMLGTVYAQNAAGEVRYFDYRREAAYAFIGAVSDVRVARHDRRKGRVTRGDDWMEPRHGQKVWFGIHAAGGN